MLRMKKVLAVVLSCGVLLVTAPAGFAQEAQQAAYSAAQIDELVSPIALYPDSLLAEVFMASAYPTDIVQAERWRESHKNLKGDQLTPSTNKIGTTASNHWWRRRRGVYRFACEAI